MSDSLRILRVAQSLYPEVMGGVGLHVHNMSSLQADMGHEVTILTSDNGNRSLPREEVRDGYRIMRHREAARPVDNSLVLGLLRSLHELSSEFDVLHVHSHLYFSSNLSALYQIRAQTPMVVTNHGLVSQTAPLWLQKAFIPTIGRFTFEAADRILCYTETDHDRLRDRGITTDISIIHNGVDCSTFKPKDSETEQQLLFVGRLREGKGAKYLLDAVKELSPEYSDLTLKLVGDGPLRADLERRTSDIDIDNRVAFLGEVPNDELPELYNQSQLFVLPSLSEGLPRTVLEAMACETPVITTALPQLESIVHGAGTTVPARSPTELASAIASLIDAPARREEMGRIGRNRVRSSFSWKRTVAETTKCYFEVSGTEDTQSRPVEQVVEPT